MTVYRELAAIDDVVEDEYREYLASRKAKFERSRELDFAYSRKNIKDLADVIADRVERQEPYCLIRLGDGEGGCLNETADQFPNLHRVALVRTLSMHFGPQPYSEEDLEFWHRSLSQAVAAADLISCPKVSMCLKVAEETPHHLRGTVGVVAAGEYILDHQAELKAELFATWHVHRALLPYYERFARGRHVRLITCYDDQFGERLARKFACDSVRLINIPGQAANDGRPVSPLYPDHMDRVLGELDEFAETGQVWFIAAGPAGKEFCQRAAARGCVALDVGSMMDVWWGRGVRGYQGDDFVEEHKL
ncbi:MAG: hypothetical protein ABR601_11010 [Parasphingopyxis sp.]|nr:hypothetical protein [Sphingomonadales bacterium]